MDTSHLNKLNNILPRQRFIITGEAHAVLKNARQFNPDGNELSVYQLVYLPVLFEQDAMGDNISVMRSDGMTQFFSPDTEVIILKL